MEREDKLSIIALVITSGALSFAYLCFKITSDLNQILGLLFPILLHAMVNAIG